ncbi:MAG: 30S ribosomal protein S3 [Victivallales bacterium]|nr:30S ribosomal protein S3 [Victivallales bacterium]MBR4221197.1 30S ribosomal protein S3 [Victivallales bacterium]
MGQKVNPIGFRLPITKDWKSRWFARKNNFGKLLQEDIKIREKLTAELANAGVSKIVIERSGKRVRITIFSARPGIILGGKFSSSADAKVDKTEKKGGKDAKKGVGIDMIKEMLKPITGAAEVLIEVKEIRNADVDAQLVAEGVVQQLVKRVAFRRAMKRAIQNAMEKGAEGIKIRCAGRLNGAELARTEQYKEGKVPLHTLRANIDYGFSEAHTLAGLIGVKVWICKPQNWEDSKNAFNAQTRGTSKGSTRQPRGNRDSQ